MAFGPPKYINSSELEKALPGFSKKFTNSSSGYSPELFYNIDPSTWYETYPFSFDLRKNGVNYKTFEAFDETYTTDISSPDLLCRFFLPIPPQNYTIQDMSTAEAHATIGGVVEETSAPVFSMITLVGTTGLSIKSPNLGNGAEKDLQTRGRKYIDELEVSKLGGIVKNLINSTANLIEQEDYLQYQDGPSAVNTPTNKLTEKLFQNSDDESSGGGLFNFDKFKESFSGQKIPNNEFTNGWAWSQALRQFFLIYQRERGLDPSLELYFVDHKSRAHYRCVPRSIQFQQNANSPYLINYTIILKCWDLKDVDKMAFQAKSQDRFNGDLKEVNTASITGIVSKVGKVCNTLNRFPSVAGSFLRNSTGSII